MVFFEFDSSKTPVEPLAETRRFRPELNPVNVLEEQSGNGSRQSSPAPGEQFGLRRRWLGGTAIVT
jgi:hypothetical protein